MASIEGEIFQPCNPFTLTKVQTWCMMATSAFVNDDPAIKVIRAFRPDAVLIDGMFFGAAIVADLLNSPLLVVMPTLIPPLEEVLFGIEEPVDEVCNQMRDKVDRSELCVCYMCVHNPLAWIQASS